MRPRSIPVSKCPKCGSDYSVVNKLLTTDMDGDSYFLEKYVLTEDDRFFASPYTDGKFVNALFCRSCEVGFIPDSLLDEMGVEKNSLRGRFGRVRPSGKIVSDGFYEQTGQKKRTENNR